MDADKVVNAFEKELRGISRLMGLPRAEIARTLYVLNLRRGNHWEAELWKRTKSRASLEWWIEEYKERGGYDEGAFLEIARLLPAWAKRTLLAIAKKFSTDHRGRQPKLTFKKRLHVLRRFRELTQPANPKKRVAKSTAYEKLAFEMGVSAHTVRCICDPRERERNSGRHLRGVALLST